MCGLRFWEGKREDGGTLPNLHSSSVLHLNVLKPYPSFVM